jgi:ankyrin repeat protein
MSNFSFKQWYNLITEGQNEDQALAILQNNQNALNQLKSISPETKYLPALAFFYLQHKDFNELQQYFNKLQELVNRRRINYQPLGRNGVKINNEVVNIWLKFTEIIDGLANLQQQKPTYAPPSDNTNLHQEEDEHRIFSNQRIKIYKSNSPQLCIQYGQGYGFCISKPGNTMWQSYRDTQTSTFYFVFDLSRSQSDPLHIVVVDMKANGPILTDANNRTGTIAEYGKDANAYLGHLKSLGVPIAIFENIPKNPEEKEEHKQLSKENKDLKWFNGLSPDYKSKYIGRGHALTNEQFDLLWNGKAEKLLQQYVNIGRKLNDYQMDKVFTSNSLKNTYLRQRLIANEHTNDLNRKEYDQLPPESQQKVKNKILNVGEPNHGMDVAAKNGHKDIVEIMIKKGANDFNRAMVQAAKNGHKDIVELMISKGANHFNSAMINAAKNGHKDIVELMISKGANDLHSAMFYAAEYGHKDIVELMISKGENDFDLVMDVAASEGYKDIVELMISKGANNFNSAMNSAALKGHKDIVELMISKGANDFNGAMVKATTNGHKDIVELMISKGANDFDEAIELAKHYRHNDIVELLKRHRDKNN